ncbi:hypothetical protein G3578_14195 [Brevibacillus sp. SYP-B805]|uniref:hypothetical protein n=1 Tax=Brevibacillus sp. SYP-B805 TaxID=1578199 RepID=UPI0013EB0FEB|nr:hypothetical protein [Brevibacillus sp. SYP-B805]NGQ96312.1 hypothetical protein [Brevibacillus sp. SYP-B805]
MHDQHASGSYRRFLSHMDNYNLNHIQLRNPWLAAWSSAAFPSFGHLKLGFFLKGSVLMIWEFLINVNANLNTAFIYSFTGRFDQAKQALDVRWLLLYIPVCIYAIWDSYRLTVDINHQYLLADTENAPIQLMKISGIGINFLDKRVPWVAAVWSALIPGVGHLYLQ